MERDILKDVDEDDVIKTFMAIRNRRPQKNSVVILFKLVSFIFQTISVLF